MERIIVEILPHKGKVAESYHAINKSRVTLGRSYSNDIIIDDLYISAQHLLIFLEDGKIQIKDLDSDNGTQVNGAPKFQNKTVSLESGDIVELGRSRLRLLLPNHPVEPARKLDKLLAFREFIDRPWVPALSYFIMIGLGTLQGFIEMPGEKFWGEEFYTILIAFSAMVLSYAGLLSLYTFFKFKKSYFVRNLVITSVGSTLDIVKDMLSPFLYFWVLNNNWMIFLDYGASFLFMLATFWVCVRLVKDSMGWVDIARLSWVPLGIVLLAAVSSKDISFGFNKAPVYHSLIAPGMSPLTEPLSLDQFLEKGAQEFSKLEDK